MAFTLLGQQDYGCLEMKQLSYFWGWQEEVLMGSCQYGLRTRVFCSWKVRNFKKGIEIRGPDETSHSIRSGGQEVYS
jgi:hypothetical protein